MELGAQLTLQSTYLIPQLVGLDYVWKWNLVEAQKQREEKQNLEASMRESLRAVQERRADAREDNNSNQNQIENINVQYAQQQHRQRRRSRDEVHVCTYPDIYVNGKCQICDEIHPCKC